MVNLIKENEKRFLNTLAVVSSIVYIIIELLTLKKSEDFIFIIMLLVSTIFLNYRQYKLKEVFLSRDGKRFINSIYNSRGEKDKDDNEKPTHFVNSLFYRPWQIYMSIIFAILLPFVLRYTQAISDNSLLSIALMIFLFIINIPTGLAIIRFLVYHYMEIEWIKNINFELGEKNNKSSTFIKNISQNVMITAVVYSAMSLSSILFSTIQMDKIGNIVLLYTLFAATLVIISPLLTGYYLRKSYNEVAMQYLFEIDVQISDLIKKTIKQNSNNSVSMERINELNEIKSILTKQNKGEFDFSKLLSTVGLLVITVIPTILQWFLDNI